MKRLYFKGKGKKVDKDEPVFCAVTGALIPSDRPANVVSFPRPFAKSGEMKREVDRPTMVDNDDI